MYLLLVLLPLLGSIFSGFFGRHVGRRGGVVLTVSFLVACFALSCFAFYEVALCGSILSLTIMDWFVTEMFDASWGLYFDSLTVVMLLVITSVSSLVHIYSASYMWEDPHLPRFMSYLSLFTFFMLMLVTADNMLQMFFGWEGVGLSSYLLINFWFTRLQANKASIKAMLVNRVGDFGLALGILLLFCVFKGVNFHTIFACAPSFAHTQLVFANSSWGALDTIAVLLFVGGIGKSAQLGLHTWLADAMEGPTPVSALIHAATMVTAGVFMIARCSPLFEYAPKALMLVALVGAMTCLFAGTTGMVQNDLKRVIAYSTCSQLGYMVFACGISNYSVGVFHLMNHAFFKALLFLSAGCVIHAISNEQDMRKMGGLIHLLPLSYAMMLIGSLSLVGFPFLTGFYSKDVILEVAYARYTVNGNFAYCLGIFSVFLTSYYSFRLLFLTFISPNASLRQYTRHTHEAPPLMAFPLFFLCLGSIFVGFLGKDMMIGIGTQFWGNALFVLPDNSNLLESEYIPGMARLSPLLLTLCGALLAYLVCCSHVSLAYRIQTHPYVSRMYAFFNKRYFFDKVYNDFLAGKAIHFGYQISFKSLDKGSFEMIGPQGISLSLLQLTRYVSQLQSGLIYHYALVMLIALTLFISLVGISHMYGQFVDVRLCFLFLVGFVLTESFKNVYTSASTSLLPIPTQSKSAQRNE